MKKYEVVFILDMRKVEDEGKAFAEEFGKNVQSWGGKIVETIPMGRRQFAREIRKRKAGVYWDFVAELDEQKANDIREKYRLDERVVRLLVINYDRPDTVPAGQKAILE